MAGAPRSPSRRAPEPGRRRGAAARLLLALALGLAGCRAPGTPPPGSPGLGAPDPRLAQLEADNRALTQELERLRRENEELRGVLDRLRALELELEMRRRQTR